MKTISLRAPYLIFLGSETDPTYAKTGAGLVQWREGLCMGQMHLQGGTVDLGLDEHDIESAANAGAKSLLIGTAVVGGAIPDAWLEVLEKALAHDMDIVAGVHTKLKDIPRLVAAAKTSKGELIDVRVPPENIPVGTGIKRSGKRVLTVGTDCALGKKYTALALTKSMEKLGADVAFRATGQTGIMIAGSGIPIDAVVADFLSGAAELVSPENHPDHWDVIEGQGSLFHPGYSAVSVGLLVGSQPDAFVVCTEANRSHIKGWPSFELPSIAQVIERTVSIGAQLNPNIHCIGISVNTQSLDETETEQYLEQLSAEFGVPAADPIKHGMDSIAIVLLAK